MWNETHLCKRHIWWKIVHSSMLGALKLISVYRKFSTRVSYKPATHIHCVDAQKNTYLFDSFWLILDDQRYDKH